MLVVCVCSPTTTLITFICPGTRTHTGVCPLLAHSCILEVYEAITAQVPIVALYVRGKEYSFEEVQQYLTFLDTELERSNPGASKLLAQHRLDPLDAAYKLSNVIPKVISVTLNMNESRVRLDASVAEIVQAMDRAVLPELPNNLRPWE